MLHLILGKDWVKNRDLVLAQVSEDVRLGKENRILMVPELVSHDMERRLCSYAGDTASRYAEVISFSRLVRRVAAYKQIAVAPTLDNGGRVVAMAAACRQLHSVLKAYASVETKPEFLTGLLDAVDEFKRCCITPADLKAASMQASGAFAQKLEELALIMEAYNGICAHGKCDPRDQMTWLLEQMEDSDFAANHVFYIDGFPDFTRQHMAILAHLIRTAPSVTVSLTTPAPGSGLLAFEKAGDTAKMLLRIAEETGVPVNIISAEQQATPLANVRDKLFQGAVSLVPDAAASVQLFRADSIHAECVNAARLILDKVRSGCRYRDISVVCADLGKYSNELQFVFNRCGIPAYLSGTEDILRKSVVTTVLSAMDAALGDFDRQDVLRYLKSPLSPLSRQRCDRLEYYATMWGVQGGRWLADWEFHPGGLSAQWTDSSRKKLEEINASRELAIEPLARLRKAFRAAADLSQQVEALYAFLAEIRLAERLRAMAEAMDAEGDGRNAQILNQLWEILLGALEQLHDVLGSTVWDTQTFTRLFTLLLSQYDVGTIPSVLDSVTVGSVSAMRCHQVDHLIVLGAEEGALPGYCGSSGVLSDQERDALRSLGVPLTGGSMEGLQAEFAEIYGVFCCANKTVAVSCSSAQPSYLYRRLLTMAGGQLQIPASLCVLTDPRDVAALLSRKDGAVAAAKLGIEDVYADISQRSGYELGTVSRENITKLYGEKLRLSASQVDRQAQCRFRYFLHHGLRAQEYKEVTVDPAEFGTYVHAVLEETAKEVMDLGGFHAVSLEKTMEIAMEHSRRYAAENFSQLESQRMTYLFRRNIQELEMIVRELWTELRHSLFEPVDFELEFSDNGKMAAIEIPGRRMQAQLRGFVDRVDAWHNGYTSYYRVVDYKTGRKDFDYCDVLNGLGLQMLLYLFALEKGDAVIGENPIPAGVQYFPARSPLLTVSGRLTQEQAEQERAKYWKRKGLVLEDRDVLQAMQPEGSPDRLSCKIGEDSISGDVADREQLQLLKRYIFHLLGNMVDEIASGKVTPNPYTRGPNDSACTYCPYKSICHYIHVPERRNFRAVTAKEFWDQVTGEVSRLG